MRFAKMHGAGNDFVVVDARGVEKPWGDLALALCDRHFGVGADQLILVQSSQIGDLRMGIFNADGSEAEMCGNGIRCFTKFVLERAIVPWPKKALWVETLAGVLPIEPMVEGDHVVRARVGMGAPRLQPQQVPVDLAYAPAAVGAGRASTSSDERVMDWPLAVASYSLADESVMKYDLRVTGVSMGNPHAVAFLETPVEEFPLEQIGPQVEHHPMFPQRVNFEVVNVLDRRHLRARVWERGAGLTLACGSGACAIAVTARLHGYTDDTIDITLPGGVLQVTWEGQGEVVLEGPAEEVFVGEWVE